MPADPNREGVLLVRVWLHDGVLVARLLSPDRDGGDEDLAPVAGVRAILEAVSRWLVRAADRPLADETGDAEVTPI